MSQPIMKFKDYPLFSFHKIVLTDTSCLTFFQLIFSVVNFFLMKLHPTFIHAVSLTPSFIHSLPSHPLLLSLSQWHINNLEYKSYSFFNLLNFSLIQLTNFFTHSTYPLFSLIQLTHFPVLICISTYTPPFTRH